METFIDALGEVTARRPDLTLDPLAALIAVLVIVTYAALRLTGRKKSRRQRIAEMEDTDFPEGVDAFEERREAGDQS